MEFYRQLKSIDDFEQIQDLSFFTEAPSDWMVVLSDIKGSTQAVKQGRAKDVNLLGASIITLVTNNTNQFNTISVFGGDGATLLMSVDEFAKLRPQLVGLMRLAQEKFNIELRIGGVPVSVLNQQGHKVWVGKYRLSPTTELAQFVGSGISRAETMIKSKAEGCEILSLGETWQEPNLRGLSCRMSRFPNRKGTVLSLIAKGKTEAGSAWIRQSLVSELKKILHGDFQSSNPVKESGLHWRWLPQTLKSEIKLQSRRPWQVFGVLLKALFANTLLRLNISMGGFVPETYKKEVALQSDFKKYDDALRMVIDCSTEQTMAIKQILEQAYQKGLIFYGVHESDGAVVTCLTLTASAGQHVHFVDGEGCGYSMASIQLKEQMKTE